MRNYSLSRRYAWLAVLLSTFCVAQTSTKNGSPALPAVGSCLQRSIPISVLRSDNNLDLRLSLLRVNVEGQSASTVSLERQNISPRVVLLLDVSGSMARFSGTEWANGVNAAELALEGFPQQSQVALVTFGEGVGLAAFDNRSAVDQKLIALKNMKPRGRTALYTAVEQSLQLFGTAQFGDTIFIVSDAEDDAGPTNPKTVSNELTERGIRAFAFLMVDPNEGPTRDRHLEIPIFGEFVKSTGGSAWVLRPNMKWPDGKDNSLMIRTMRNQIGLPYRLDIALTDSPTKPAKLQIATTTKGVELAYPQHLESCWSATPATNR